MKKVKILLVLAVVACMFASIAVTSSADVLKEPSFAAIKFEITETATPPVADGVISEGEYDKDCIVLDNSGNNTEAGGWVGNWNVEKFTYYFTWDKTNLYVGFEVTGDESPSQNGPADSGWFRKGDMFQIAFNPDNKVGDYTPPMLNVGLTENAQPVVERDNFGSLEEGKQTGVTDVVKGYSTKWADGKYVCEIAVPWHDCVFVNALGRAGEGSPKLDLSAMEPTDGLVIGLWLVYANDFDGPDGTSGDVCLRTDMTTGCGWIASQMSTLAIVLDALPEPTEEPTPEPTAAPTDAPVDEKKGCKNVILESGAILTLALAAAVIVSKKRK